MHIEMLDKMVSYARNAGLMYIIVVRDGPGRIDISDDTGGSTIWKNKAEQQLYGKMLKEMAQRYLPDSLFVGMSFSNEPNPLGELWEPPIAELDSALIANNIDINALQTLWVDSIRTIDKDLPLLIGGVHANHPEYYSLMKKQNDDKIVYITHLYNPGNYSHAQTPYSETYPGEYWSVRLNEQKYFNKAFMKNELYKPVRDFQKKYNVPVFAGEFGIRYPQNGGEQYIRDIGEIACEFGWHYAIWSFNGGPQFNYKALDSVYGTSYWQLVKSLMNCSPTSVGTESFSDFTIGISPNPFTESATINYELQTAVRVRIDIFNALGEKITTLVDEYQAAGRHSTKFSVGAILELSLQSGIYFYRIQIGERTESGKLMLVR